MSEAAGCLRDATNDLLSSMEEAASASGAVTTMIDNISKAIAKVYSFIAALKYKENCAKSCFFDLFLFT